MAKSIFHKWNILLLFVSCNFAIKSSCACQTIEQRFVFPNSDVYLRLARSTKLHYQIMKGSKTLKTIALDNFSTTENFKATNDGTYTLSDGTSTIEFKLIRANADITHVNIIRNNVLNDTQPRDCINLDSSNTHWLAGPENVHQYWPIEKQKFDNYAFVTKESQNAAVSDRYFLNSNGLAIYVENDTPLFIEQNSPGYENKLCLIASNALPYNFRASKVSFKYHVVIGDNAKKTHMYAVEKFLGKPSSYPDQRMVEHPIWSTWALYKTKIDDSIVRDFADQILKNGFNNSQLEIDDDWEDCYGALTFRKNKFPNIKQLTDDLKSQGFRVTLWVHPFINKDCTDWYEMASNNGYLVLNHDGSPDTQWWNSIKNDAAYVDFTKSEVQQWFVKRLSRLQTEDGIDNFKFDAGETSFGPADPILQGSINLSPTQLTQDYVRTVGSMGPMVEVRAAHGTQDLAIFLRMIDKDSEWYWKNGLVTLITTLLQMNMNGYNFVLPDMIGGNGYNNKPPSKELFIRWLQANVFMPSLQFSYVPWNFDAETIEISKTFTSLHVAYAPKIMERFKLAVETGEPVNPPLFWADPDDQVAYSIFDEFMLGDDIIAAPVVVEGAITRDIYLPKGQWKDGNTDKIYTGPIWIMDYPAPLNTLPYFIRSN